MGGLTEFRDTTITSAVYRVAGGTHSEVHLMTGRVISSHFISPDHVKGYFAALFIAEICFSAKEII